MAGNKFAGRSLAKEVAQFRRAFACTQPGRWGSGGTRSSFGGRRRRVAESDFWVAYAETAEDADGAGALGGSRGLDVSRAGATIIEPSEPANGETPFARRVVGCAADAQELITTQWLGYGVGVSQCVSWVWAQMFTHRLDRLQSRCRLPTHRH